MDRPQRQYLCQQCSKSTERLYFCAPQCNALFFNKEQEEALLDERDIPKPTMMSPISGRSGGGDVNK